MAHKKPFNNYKIKGKITEIFLYNRQGDEYKSLIDTKNLSKLKDLNQCWHLEWNNNTQSYYVQATVYQGIVNGKPKQKTLRMHNFLLGTEPYQKADHINHDTLDNRECNIRETTVAQNATHRKGINSNNKSGYRNVSWINGFWRIQLQINGNNHLFPEKFTDVDEAGAFAQQMRQKYYGEFAGYE